jgi:hypothetical protein
MKTFKKFGTFVSKEALIENSYDFFIEVHQSLTFRRLSDPFPNIAEIEGNGMFKSSLST